VRTLFLVLSLVLACLSFSSRWIVHSPATNPAGFVLESTPLAALWFTILVVSIRRYRRRGYWVLIGAPLVLYWPLMLVLTVFGCVIGNAPCD